ncbi:MAG: glucose PTS transporter subunit IIA [Mycoplasmoidaceae bacterium]|nr:glucose PTS transporter subunit IIA [Mycoplasmoidaceae bacterium]
MNLFGAHMGMTFSGGFIDFIIYGALPDALGAKANCYIAVCIGLVLIPIYFFGFYFLIKKFDIKTPGREGNEIKLFTKKDFLAKNGNGQTSEINQQSNAVIKAYGGKDNIKNVDACITKLRVQVIDPNKVNKQELMNLGAKGVMYPSKQSVYAVFGTNADRIKNEMKDIIAGRSPTVDVAAPATKTKQATKEVKKQSLIVCSPVSGQVVSTKKVNDQTFSQDIMGKGFAIIPSNGKFVAPVDGKIALIDNHAFAIETKQGYQVLVHIGIDTVKIANKKPFSHLVKVGANVKIGQPIVEANIDLIKKNKLNPITPVIVLNETLGKSKVSILKQGKVSTKEKVLSIK